MHDVHKKNVTITGGNGFVGRLLRAGLGDRGYRIDVFDKMRGPLLDVLRYRYFGTSAGLFGRASAKAARLVMSLSERQLLKTGALTPSADDIRGDRSALARRFEGSYAVIHLAGLAHPRIPGMTELDYRRINYEGSINVFEAAREARVSRFIFASSVQVYGINQPTRVDRFPIEETNYLPTKADGQSAYALLKLEFEQYLAEHAGGGSGPQSVSLRLEFPGVRSRYAWNQYISTSVENTVAGFAAAVEADAPGDAEVFNLADAEVDRRIVDVQAFLKKRWPEVPNETSGNQCLLSTEKARRSLGYAPVSGGTYFELAAMW